ncbi:conserved exported protein of unknown function [Bartonella clarridgeiae 73]|uniref:SH3b domain-containing protein n=1 Tax=Bartonella clarridgeiae (strain CCUG 45776 / CIP 104772 / 73) TaxID=696125 RepID=E6YH44_BARC7|nr:SH3 domain-containing protein [Bartonella clarridgeiae]WCR55236.1 MAG: Bacterial SH3 domain protein [Bartonella clarridgeiae]CBI76182.1 conserved exported protein of unknown function [Bartonella clarridgeiae 73]
MFKKSFLSATMMFTSLVGAGLIMATSDAAAATVAKIEKGKVLLRAGPSTTYKAAAIVPTGAKVQINGCLANKVWCLLQHNETVGWASANYFNIDNVPVISFMQMKGKPKSVIQKQIVQEKKIVSNSKDVFMPRVIEKNIQEKNETGVIVKKPTDIKDIVPTGVKKTDERIILKPSENTREISVKRVTAYNPLFPDNVNFENAERNETRYRVITYPIL